MNCTGNKHKFCDLPRTECSKCYDRCFASHPKSKFWSIKNSIDPHDVFKGSNARYIFLCYCGHEFDAKLGNINTGYWCPYCTNKKLCNTINCDTCYNKSFASHDKSKYLFNESEDPRMIFLKCNKKYKFKCTCGHLFCIRIANITSKNNWCSYCTNQKLCNDLSCDQCFNKSFAASPFKKYWSKGNKLKPREVFLKTSKKFVFECDKCNHTFEKSLSSISRRNRLCPFCSKRKMCFNKDCSYCHKLSFISHPRSKYLDESNEFCAREVFKSSEVKGIFRCDCGHKFVSKLANVSTGTWCPYCANNKLCGDINCEECKDKSFYNYSKSDAWMWSYKNKLEVHEVFRTSNKKYIFNCCYGHEFKVSLDNLVKNKRGCPHCKNKTEHKLLEYLKTIYPRVKHQYKVKWCKNPDTDRYLPFDFMIPSLNIIIELDGRQHFEQVSNWKDHCSTKKRDVYKMRCALAHGFTIIRILQNDVWQDINDWKNKLRETLYVYESPTWVFISENREYADHRKLLVAKSSARGSIQQSFGKQ